MHRVSAKAEFTELPVKQTEEVSNTGRLRFSIQWSVANIARLPEIALANIAKSIVINGQIFTLPRSPEENSTYSLQFRAPQFSCSILDQRSSIHLYYTGGRKEIDSSPLEYRPYLEESEKAIIAQSFTSHWDSNSLIYSNTVHEIDEYAARWTSRDNITDW